MNKLILGIYLYRIFSRAYFYLPFLLIYFLIQGYSIIQLEILMASYGIAAFLFSLYKEKCFKICNLKDSNKLVVSEIFKIIGLLLLLYQNQYLILESSPDSCVKCYTMFLPFLLIKIDVF
ncbi:hypothetical protein P7814_09130, partial [Staphylococcus aureus]|nr:hypothetical protein [Staphylococcus aureus]